MATGKTRYLSAVLLMVGVAGRVLGCKACGEAGRAARASVACTKACELGFRPSLKTTTANCRDACLARVVGSGPQCEPLHLAWLDCLQQSSGREGNEPAFAACSIEQRLVEQCELGCRAEGQLRSGTVTLKTGGGERVASYEFSDCGCGDCRAKPGARSGAACSSAKVCQEYVLSCDAGAGRKKLRACVGGSCADAELVNALLREVAIGSNCAIAAPPS